MESEEFRPEPMGSEDSPLSDNREIRRPYRGLFGSRRADWLVFFLLALLIVAWLSPQPHALKGFAGYPPLHTAMEVFAVVVASLIFATGWHAYTTDRPANILLLSCTFVAVGLLDFAHLLSYQGMPAFVTPSGPEKAIYFWLAARFLAALALLAVAALPWRPLRHPWTRQAVYGSGVLYAVLVTWLILWHEDIFPTVFVAGKGLTPAKNAAEYLIVGLAVLTTALLAARKRQRVPYVVNSLMAATVIMGMSELLFTLYSDVTDGYNLLGHLYKIVSYGFLYQAAFVAYVREPYEELRASRHALSRSLTQLDVERQKMEGLARRVIDLQEQERQYLASEIHDDLLQGLVATSYFVEALNLTNAEKAIQQRQAKLSGVLRTAIQKGRTLIGEMRPVGEPESSFTEALDMTIEVTLGDSEVKVTRNYADSLPDMSITTKTNILRIVQEALMNVRKHSQATEVSLSVVAENASLEVEIADNGAGFDLKKTRESALGHYGLLTMQERALLVDGELSMSSQPGRGTAIRGVFPLDSVTDIN